MAPDAHTTRLREEDGFTIIEVLVAMVVLTVAVLGTFSLLDASYASTAKTTAREQGTNLARDVLERSRQIAYLQTRTDLAPAALRNALPDAGALSGSSFTVARRKTTYTVTVFSCSVDDPSDGAGYGDATFCAPPASTGTTGAVPLGLAAGINVLGLNITAGGSLISTVCNAVGTSSTVLSTLTAAVSTAVPLSVCPSGSTGTVAYDSRPDDVRNVRVTVTWNDRGRTRTLQQVTLLTNPQPNDCPATTPVAPATLPSGCPTPIS